MLKRKKILWVSLGIAIVFEIGTLAFRQWTDSSPSDHPIYKAVVPKDASNAFDDEYVKVREAERIDDPLQRCLAYPSLPEFNWDPKVVDAFCRLAVRKVIGWDEFSSAVSDHRTDVLEQIFASYLNKTYEPGQHGFLCWAFKQLFESSAQPKERYRILQAWIDADPHSAFALAARGTYYVRAAWDARGNKFVGDTPHKNFVRMREFIDKARVDFDESLKRNPRLIASYHGLLQIARLTSDRDLLAKSVEGAFALDRADHSIYSDWMVSVEPKWGGSLEAMTAVATKAQEYADENPLLQRLRAEPICYEAEMMYCAKCKRRAGTDETALNLLRNAAAFGPATCFLNEAPRTAERVGDSESAARFYSQAYRFLGGNNNVLRRAQSLSYLKRGEWGRESIAMILKSQPRNAEALAYRGWLEQSEHKLQDAEKSFLAVLVIDPSNREATAELVNLYTNELHEKGKAEQIVERLMSENPSNARAWLLKAALQKGGDESQCKEALKKYLSLVDDDPDDAYEQRDIARAKARLVELGKGAIAP
ncbi:MAG: DUF4034 domain-containing protein [Rudaea sp.]